MWKRNSKITRRNGESVRKKPDSCRVKKARSRIDPVDGRKVRASEVPKGQRRLRTQPAQQQQQQFALLEPSSRGFVVCGCAAGEMVNNEIERESKADRRLVNDDSVACVWCRSGNELTVSGLGGGRLVGRMVAAGEGTKEHKLGEPCVEARSPWPDTEA